MAQLLRNMGFSGNVNVRVLQDSENLQACKEMFNLDSQSPVWQIKAHFEQKQHCVRQCVVPKRAPFLELKRLLKRPIHCKNLTLAEQMIEL